MVNDAIGLKWVGRRVAPQRMFSVTRLNSTCVAYPTVAGDVLPAISEDFNIQLTQLVLDNLDKLDTLDSLPVGVELRLCNVDAGLQSVSLRSTG